MLINRKKKKEEDNCALYRAIRICVHITLLLGGYVGLTNNVYLVLELVGQISYAFPVLSRPQAGLPTLFTFFLKAKKRSLRRNSVKSSMILL